jgi:hypothetical protein
MFETLIASGLGLLAKVGLAKGKDWLKEKTGVDLDKAALSPEDLLALQKYQMDHETELLRITLEAEGIEAKELTTRLQADMGSDSWMSKNIRPMVLAVITTSLVAALFLPASYITVERFQTIADLALWVFGFYFGARSIFDKGSMASIAGKLRK